MPVRGTPGIILKKRSLLHYLAALIWGEKNMLKLCMENHAFDDVTKGADISPRW